LKFKKWQRHFLNWYYIDFASPYMSKEARLPSPSSPEASPSPFKNLTGALISATLATGLYAFTNMVAHKLASAPLQTTNTLANRLATLVRTALLAIGTGATMIFAVIALGLVLLTIKQIFTSLFSKPQA
jgi:hypothetical protein